MATCLSTIVRVTPTTEHSVPSDASDVKDQMGAWGRLTSGRPTVTAARARPAWTP